MRSASLFKKTWKEAFIGRLALGWFWAGAFAAAAVPPGVCFLLNVEQLSVWLAAAALSSAIVIFVVVFVRTLDTVYRTALCVFATEGVIPEPFDEPELHAVFKVAG